MYIIYIEEMA